MPRLPYFIATVCLILVPATAFAESSTNPLPQLISACEQNVMCSKQDTGEGTLFILRHPQRTQNLLCQEDGNCVTILAKGQRIRVRDSLSQISIR
jgi:hypothetical protein